eukprot:4333590-Alexandrium_andersonii.AAC.1
MSAAHGACISTTTCTFTSGRSCCAKCAITGVAQKSTDVGPQRPSRPAPAPAVVSCWHGEPATRRSIAPCGIVRNTSRSGAALLRRKSHTSAAALR